jgi:COP9 signalosome complex subunit 7
VLANSSKGRAAAALIHEVLKSPHVFVYGALLQAPSIVALKDTEHKAHFELLQIFAFGTYAEWKSRSADLPELCREQLYKLKLISIVEKASHNKVLNDTLFIP